MFALIQSIKNDIDMVELVPDPYVFQGIRLDLNKLEEELTDLFKEVEAKETLLLADMPLEIEELT